ncbi:unnamed protein product [Rotaria sp. Silwood2]|nr:unnamed protein product [Rotaria sp. Silwood2]
MSEYSMNNDDISVKHLLTEQNPRIDNDQRENSIQNRSNSARFVNVADKIKKPTMIPTPLEYSCWSRYRSATVAGAFSMFTIIAMVIGVLTVYFTSPKLTGKKCELKFISTDKNPIEYNYGPRSVAVGNFNNDDWLDIVVANQAVNFIVILLGNDDATFSRQIKYSTGDNSSPYMVAVGDLNNDNRLDIAVANFGANNILIFFGFGDGSFGNQTVISTTSSRPLWIHIADINNDILLDIVIVSYGTNSISVLFGYGHGHFSSPIKYSTGYDSLPLSVVSGDFNNDNQLDLAIANSGTNNVLILLGNAENNFTEQATFSTGSDSHPCSLAVGHFNDDFLLDIAVANFGADNVGVFIGHGNGTFILQTTNLLDTSSPYFITAGDFNNDKRLDLVTTNKGTNSVSILIGYGNGSFLRPTMYSAGSSFSTSLAIGDFNNDNRLDVSVVNNETNSISILLGYDEGFANLTTYSAGSRCVAVGDFNNDARLDIVVTDDYDRTVTVLLGYGDGSFENRITSPTGFSQYSVAVADLNNDTKLDIVVVYQLDQKIGILLGNGDGSFANQILYSTASSSNQKPYYSGSQPYFVAIADFNKDDRLDIVVVNNGDNNIGIFLGYGNGSFASQTTFSTGSEPYSVAVGDFNNDTRLDIVVANLQNDSVSVLLGYGNGSFAKQMTYLTGSQPCYVAVGDFDNDTRLDIVVVNQRSHNVGILLGYGNGSFAKQTTYKTGFSPHCVTVGDFNNDSRLDIVVANTEDNNVGVFLGYGNGSFGTQTTYSTNSYPYSIAVGDFNNDARLDIVVASIFGNDVGILLHYNRGTLTNKITFASSDGSHLRSFVTSDFNNDGLVDIVVANYGTNNIGFLQGHGHGTFGREMITTISADSYPYAIAIGDFDKDSELDVAVANHGSNNVDIFLGDGMGRFVRQINYGDSFDQVPSVVATGDLNNDGRSEIIVAYNDNDNVYIHVPYDTSSFTNQMTYSTGSYPYSVAVGDFNNDARLDIVVANREDDNIGIFIGYGNGTFATQMTYSTGSFPYSVAVGDFNNDARLDIVVANRNDDNIGIFIGYGNGTFATQMTYSTNSYLGFVSWPCSVAVGDFNNDARLDIVVANSAANGVGILLGYGNGSFSSQTSYSSMSSPESVAVGDFDSNACLDIVVANYYSDSIDVRLGHCNGTFGDPITYKTDTLSHLSSIAVGDFDNDTRVDIVVVNYGYNNIGVLLGYKNGSFANQRTYSTGSRPTSVAVGDLNKDDRLDIVVTNSNGISVSVLLGHGNGFFTHQTTYSTGLWPISIAIGDFNNDTRLDIVVANRDSKNVSVLLGHINVVFVKKMLLTTGLGSRPQSFVFGHFNNDDRLDIAIANSGTNNVGIFLGTENFYFTNQTMYETGAASRPYSLAVGDFNNDTQMDIVVANYGSNTVGIFLGYGNGSFSSQKTFSIGDSSVIDMTIVSDIIYVDQRLILSQKLDNSMKYLLPNQKQTFIAGSILFSKMYSSFSRYEHKKRFIQMKKKESENKINEKSITEVNGELMEFTPDDRSYPRSEETDAELDHMAIELIEHGHNLDSSWISRKIRASAACHISGRLALAFNLIQKPIPSLVQITNNIRICDDCHEFMKRITKLRQCEIVIRDPNRIHRFYQNGECF